MLYSEFLKGIREYGNDATYYAYEVINKLYSEDKLKSQAEAFDYYCRHKSQFSWIDPVYAGYGLLLKKHDSMVDPVGIDYAKEIINKEFGFEIDKIQICGNPYYECSDMNHIVFICGSWSWCMHDGEIYQAFR